MSPKANSSKKSPAGGSVGKRPRKTSGAAPASKAAGKSATGKKKPKVVAKRKRVVPGRASGTRKASTSRPARRRTRKAGPKRKLLTARQLDHYRQLLLKKQQELTESYYQAKGESRSDLDDGTEDYIDYAVHSYAREFLLSLTELERKQLYLVENALKRIERGQYGVCQQCNKAISPKRLEVAPAAQYCVPCQELEEKGLLPQEEPDADEEQEEIGAEEQGVDEEADYAEDESDDDADEDDDPDSD